KCRGGTSGEQRTTKNFHHFQYLVKKSLREPRVGTTPNSGPCRPGPAHHHQTWYQGFLALSFEGCCFWFCSTVLLANVCAFMPDVCISCGCVASEWSELPLVLCALFMAVRFRPSPAAA